MRDLPISLQTPTRQQLDGAPGRVQDQLIAFAAQASKVALTRVIRITTTGSPQLINTGVLVGTYHVGNASDYVRVKTLSVQGQEINLQADTAGVSLDVIVTF